MLLKQVKRRCVAYNTAQASECEGFGSPEDHLILTQLKLD